MLNNKEQFGNITTKKEAFIIIHMKNKIPHIYESITGWFSFQDFYSSIVKKFPSGSRLVEVGTYYGCSFSYLVIESLNAGKVFDIVGIDAAPEGWGVEENFDKNMKPFEGKYRKMFGGNSFDRIKEFEDESVDFMFIDANHTYEFVIRDIQAALPKMKPGGIIAGHDFNGAHPGVVQAVIESFIGDINLGREGAYHKPNTADGKPGKGLEYLKGQDVWIVQL
jgi:hypothetical protein